MYVTLEPCSHYGKTPPCTKAIIEAGIAKVHIAMVDPNPLVSGNGITELKNAGIKTLTGEGETKAQEINEAYVKFITTGLPFVIAKIAMSLDGKIATKSGDSRWISSEELRKRTHSLRYVVDGIMVGANTVIVDDPELTARGGGGKGGLTKPQLCRIVVDGQGRIPLSAQIFKQSGKTIIAISESVEENKVAAFQELGAEVMILPASEGEIDLKLLLEELGKREITNILVEGGGILLGHLVDNGLVDKVVASISPIIIGGSNAKLSVCGEGVNKISEAVRITRMTVENLGEEVLISGYLAYP